MVGYAVACRGLQNSQGSTSEVLRTSTTQVEKREQKVTAMSLLVVLVGRLKARKVVQKVQTITLGDPTGIISMISQAGQRRALVFPPV